MSFLKEVWKLTRFEHALMFALSVLIAQIISLGRFPDVSLLFFISLSVPVLSEVGSFSLNDYLDVGTDRLNKKTDRPLVNGTILPGFALWLSIICLLLSTVLSVLFGTFVFLLVFLVNSFSVLYNWKLKDLPLAGNFYIALTMGVPFIYGNLVVAQPLIPLIFILAMLGFVSGLAREIIKSIQDMAGDKAARGSKTLPLLIGEKNSLIAAVFIYLIFVPLTFVPFFYGLQFNPFAVALILAANLGIIYLCINLVVSKDRHSAFKLARKLSLISLFIGLCGFFIASI